MPDLSQLQFTDFEKPRLDDGDYTITVNQNLAIHGESPPTGDDFKLQRTFRVEGPKYSLPPADILTVFPPQGSLGGYSDSFAHVVFERSMLPWERSGWANPGEHWQPGSTPQIVDPLPWVAVLLFPSSDAPAPTTSTEAVADYTGETATDNQKAYDRVTLIEVDNTLLADVVPTADDLRYLAHVRQGLDESGVAIPDSMHSVAIGNRLPQPDTQNVVHLVSVEGRYDDSGAFTPDSGATTTLVSLKSWTFSPSDKDEQFVTLLQQLDRSPSTLQLPTVPDPNATGANDYLNSGFVPLPEQLRESQETVSWYHGPFVPGALDNQLTLPTVSADGLLIFDPDNGLFDASYAAAWELGRLLGLESRQFSQAIYNYRQLLDQRRLQAAQLEAEPDLPVRGSAKKRLELDVDVPNGVTSFLDSLRALEGVPFNYLVPDERMLPTESMRAFKIDPLWVQCLLHGAFGLGKISAHEPDLPAGDFTAMSGIFIRSAALSGWPDLMVRGYSSYEDTEGSLPIQRPTRLSSDVWMFLFEIDLQFFALHPKPGIQHFAVEPNFVDPTQFHRSVRDVAPTQNDPAPSAPVTFRDTTHRVVEVATLAAAIESKLGASAFWSRDYAYQMIETAPGVTFVNAASASPMTYIVNGKTITPSAGYFPTFTLVASALVMPVTIIVQTSGEGSPYYPFGPYQAPASGAINALPSGYQAMLSEPLANGENLVIGATSWTVNDGITTQNIVSSEAPNNVLLLQNGDALPAAAEGDSDLSTLSLEDYLVGMNLMADGLVHIGANQAIYCFELSTTDMDSPLATFKDAVILVTLYPDTLPNPT